MANWAERYSNEEKVLFEKGDWSVTEDGEKIWSLYYKGECKEPVLDFNKYILFKNGFLLYFEEFNNSSYALFLKDHNRPIFTLSGKEISLETDKNLIIFHSKEHGQTSFETEHLSKVYLADNDQLGFDI